MNIFEPLFLLLALVILLGVVTAVIVLVAGKPARAGRIVRRLAIGAAVYFGIAVVVSAVTPRRVYHVGDTQCFDDWCISVTGARRGRAPSGPLEVSLRLSSRAKRVPMGEKGTVVYLADEAGRRYDPRPDAAAVPLDTLLQPGESVEARRVFDVPADARGLGLIYTHEGGFPIGWFIISEGGWFSKPPIVRLD